MSCGAIEAGAKVVLAVDSDPAPLKVLGSNAPATTCVVATLGEGRNDVVLPPAAPDLHVHVSRAGGVQPVGRTLTRASCLCRQMSTPCTELSVARRDLKADTSAGLQMIRWAVRFVLERNDESWSLENARDCHSNLHRSADWLILCSLSCSVRFQRGLRAL